MSTNLDGNSLLNDAYAIAIDGNPEAREFEYAGAWAPSGSLTDYDLETAASEAACDAGDNNHALFEMVLEYLGGDEDPFWQELEEAAGRALRKFAEEMDEEARHYLEDEDEEDAE